MDFVIGHAGEDHVSAEDMAAMLRGLLGADNFVLEADDELACTVVDANTVQIGTGGCMLQGHYARVDVAETLAIESGTAGYYRNDLIVARYALGASNVQSCTLTVVAGTPDASTAADPAYNEGDIDGGDLTVDFPLWRIPIEGTNVGTPERIMEVRELADDATNATIPLSSSCIAAGSSGTPVYSRQGRVVNVAGAVHPSSSVASGGSLTIGTLPEGARPARAQTVVCQGSGTAFWLLDISTGGVLTASRYRNASGYAAMDTGTWLPFSATFLTS